MNFEEALNLATKLHEGQKHKISGDDYITHPIAVSSKFEDEPHKIAAILHDTVEDTDLTLNDLRNIGLDENTVQCIDILTHKDDQTYLDYILLTKKNEMSKRIKIEDLKHNLSDNPVSKCSKDKYLMALYILEES